MKRFLLIALLIAGGLLWVQSARLRSEKRERRRLELNQTALMSDVEYYRTKEGKAAASNMVLNLRVSELERLRAELDAEVADALGICRPEPLQLRDAEIKHHVRRSGSGRQMPRASATSASSSAG